MGRPKLYPVKLKKDWWVIVRYRPTFKYLYSRGEDWGRIFIYLSKEEAERDCPCEDGWEVKRVIDFPDFQKSEISYNIYYNGLTIVSN